MTKDTPKWPLKLSEMARRLGVSTRWLREEAQAGRLPHIKADTGILFDATTVERILLERLRQADEKGGSHG